MEINLAYRDARKPFALKTCAVMVALALAGCGGGSGNSPEVALTGLPIKQIASTLSTVVNEAVGVNCPTGGAKVNAGLDTNANGVLDISEITSVQYVCNGSAGTNGTTGISSLVAIIAEPSGVNCTTGGSKVNIGLDSNRNGILDASEITSFNYVCQGVNGINGTNGTNGAPGIQGVAGPAGANGTNGAPGPQGASGITSLTVIAPESAGANCTYGGNKITSGLDNNGNNVLDASEITSTNYICNGAPGPGITWVNTNSNIQAQPNIGYLANSSSPITVTLPTNPSIGDLVSVSGVGSGGWTLGQNAGQSVIIQGVPTNAIQVGANWFPHNYVQNWNGLASSADGVHLAGTGQFQDVMTSSDNGATWVVRPAAGTGTNWKSIASSSDGTKLIAGGNPSTIRISTDSGVTWTDRGFFTAWQTFASSLDGVNLLAGQTTGRLYISHDGGTTFNAQGPLGQNWQSSASSSDGVHLIAGTAGALVYTSADSGTTWTAAPLPNATWFGVASSYDGTKLVAVGTGTQIYTSTDSGATWKARDSARNWRRVTSSADGIKLAAVESNGLIYTSSDSGMTWVPRVNSGVANWSPLASSANGNKLVAGVYGGQIFTSSIDRTGYGTVGSISGSQFDSLELQYIGSGLFIPLKNVSYSGLFQAQ